MSELMFKEHVQMVAIFQVLCVFVHLFGFVWGGYDSRCHTCNFYSGHFSNLFHLSFVINASDLLSREKERGLPVGQEWQGVGLGDGWTQKGQVYRGDDRVRDPGEGTQGGRARDRGDQVRYRKISNDILSLGNGKTQNWQIYRRNDQVRDPGESTQGDWARDRGDQMRYSEISNDILTLGDKGTQKVSWRRYRVLVMGKHKMTHL